MISDAVAKMGMFRGVLELDRASDSESVGESDQSLLMPVLCPRSGDADPGNPDLGNLEGIRLKMRCEHASLGLGVVLGRSYGYDGRRG
jgi:hypothetical protein